MHFTPHELYTVHMKHHVANTELLDLCMENLSQCPRNAWATWGEGKARAASVPQASPGEDRQGKNNTLETPLQGISQRNSVTDLLWNEWEISLHPGNKFTET